MATTDFWTKLQSYDPVKLYQTLQAKGGWSSVGAELTRLQNEALKQGNKTLQQQYAKAQSILLEKYREGQRKIAEQNYLKNFDSAISKYKTQLEANKGKITDPEKIKKVNDYLNKVKSKYGESSEAYKKAKDTLYGLIDQNVISGTRVDVDKYKKKIDLGENPSEYAIGKKAGYYEGFNDAMKAFREFDTKYTGLLTDLQRQLGGQEQEIYNLKNMLDVTRKRADFTYQMLQSKDAIFNDKMQTLEKLVENMGKQYGDTYAKIGERIKQFEQELNQTYGEMEERLNKVGEDFRKILEYNQAAAGSAAEKKLAGLTGKGASLRVANYLRQVAQEGDKALADVNIKLAEQLNNLERELVNYKRMIMEDKNLNDKDKLDALKTINSKLEALTKEKAAWKQGLVDEMYQPYQDALNYQEQKVKKIDEQQFAQELTEMANKWQNESVTVRAQVLTDLLSKNLGKVRLPKTVIQKALEANTLLDALQVLNNYFVSSRTATTQQKSAIQQLLDMFKNKNAYS